MKQEQAAPIKEKKVASGNRGKQSRLDERLALFMKQFTPDLAHTSETLHHLQSELQHGMEEDAGANEQLSLHLVGTLNRTGATYTNGHSVRVAVYAREIARRAGFSMNRQHKIYMMALLHDIGKCIVPDAVIDKPGRLTDAEFETVKSHPVMGAKILEELHEMSWLVPGARWHHERFDGTGYPDGLKGAEIPEEVRIICIADAYDAMTSNRSYRKSLDQKTVREQIEQGKGKQFDPRFADILLQIIDEDTEFRLRE